MKIKLTKNRIRIISSVILSLLIIGVVSYKTSFAIKESLGPVSSITTKDFILFMQRCVNFFDGASHCMGINEDMSQINIGQACFIRTIGFKANETICSG